MREGWELVKLGDVCDFFRGLTYKKTDEVAASSNVVLRANNISLQECTLNFDELKYIREDIIIPDNKKIQRNALLVCTASGSKRHLGKTAFIDVDYDYAFGGFMGLLKPKKNIFPKFLYWLTVSKRYSDFISSLSDGANINNLKYSQLSQLVLPLPPLSEQKRIVAILDEAFEGIVVAVANAEKSFANARELFESYLNTIFTQKGEGWVETKLENICSIKHGFAFKSRYFSGEGDYVLLTPGSFYESGGYRDRGEKTKYYIGDIPEGYLLKKGDFLFAMTEQAVGLLGSSLIVPESECFLHNQRLGLVQTADGFEWHNGFFSHQFNIKKFRAAVQESASGVKVRHTSPKKLGAVPVCFPATKAEQEEIANKLNELQIEIQGLERIYQKKLAALFELKRSILQKAFTGELTAEYATSKKEAVA